MQDVSGSLPFDDAVLTLTLREEILNTPRKLVGTAAVTLPLYDPLLNVKVGVAIVLPFAARLPLKKLSAT
jgi:hypothetical protein